MKYLLYIAHSCYACQLIMGLYYTTELLYSLWLQQHCTVGSGQEEATGQEAPQLSSGTRGGERGGRGRGRGCGEWVGDSCCCSSQHRPSCFRSETIWIVDVPNRGHLFWMYIPLNALSRQIYHFESTSMSLFEVPLCSFMHMDLMMVTPSPYWYTLATIVELCFTSRTWQICSHECAQRLLTQQILPAEFHWEILQVALRCQCGVAQLLLLLPLSAPECTRCVCRCLTTVVFSLQVLVMDMWPCGNVEGTLNLWTAASQWKWWERGNKNPSNSLHNPLSKLSFPVCLPVWLLWLLQRGFVNSLVFAHSGSFLVAAVGQEHRLGRWWKDSSVRNNITIIPLPRTHNCWLIIASHTCL